MVDKNFYRSSGPYKLKDIAKHLGLSVEQKFEDILIHNVTTLSKAGKGDISFLHNKKYLPELYATQASCCIVPDNIKLNVEGSDIALLKSNNPYLTYSKLINLFYAPAKLHKTGIMPSAYISSSAKIGEGCYIGHNVVIEDDAEIGDGCFIESGSFIDAGVRIGNNCKIYSNVSISYSIIGSNVCILSGARIGQDGFGFATDEKGVHHKIFHTGRVVIGDNVEIGANTTVDRGSTDDTIIEDLCRIDNLVQIAHNVKVGRGSIIVAQVGVAGSTTIGKYCALGGQVGVAGHINIGDKSQVAAQGGVMKDIEPGVIMGGSPAVPIRDWHKQTIIMKTLIKER